MALKHFRSKYDRAILILAKKINLQKLITKNKIRNDKTMERKIEKLSSKQALKVYSIYASIFLNCLLFKK